MFKAPPEPTEVRNTDRIIACPLCGTDKPCTSVRLLRSVVERKGKFIGVIDGEKMRCEMCGGEWAYCYRTGVFNKAPALQQYPENTRTTDNGPPPTIRMTPRQRRASV